MTQMFPKILKNESISYVMLLDFAGGQFITAVVVGIVRMPLNLDPLNAVHLCEFKDALPEILVFNRLSR